MNVLTSLKVSVEKPFLTSTTSAMSILEQKIFSYARLILTLSSKTFEVDLIESLYLKSLLGALM